MYYVFLEDELELGRGWELKPSTGLPPRGLLAGPSLRSWQSRHWLLQPNVRLQMFQVDSFCLGSHLQGGGVPRLAEHLVGSFIELSQGWFVSIHPEVGPSHRRRQLLGVSGDQRPEGNPTHHLFEPVGQGLIFSFGKVQEWSGKTEGQPKHSLGSEDIGIFSQVGA